MKIEKLRQLQSNNEDTPQDVIECAMHYNLLKNLKEGETSYEYFRRCGDKYAIAAIFRAFELNPFKKRDLIERGWGKTSYIYESNDSKYEVYTSIGLEENLNNEDLKNLAEQGFIEFIEIF